MSKFFKNLPAILEPFNPVGIPEEWHGEKTFDENGLPHSFNDLPIKFKAQPVTRNSLTDEGEWLEVYEFRWYNHGRISRSGGKPPVIRVVDNSYSTLNEQMNLHSYNDQPAYFLILEDEGLNYYLDWFDEGSSHRDNDLPLSIIVDGEGNLEFESYGIHGLPHRGNNLPAEIGPASKTWLVQGVMHNIEGYAEILYPDSYSWVLYGVDVPEGVFNQFKAARDKTNMPAWVAFLLVLEIITEEHLMAFMDSNGNWNANVPVSWLLTCWKLTEEVFEHKLGKLLNQSSFKIFDLSPDEALFVSFLSVVKFEEKEASLRATQKKGNHA